MKSECYWRKIWERRKKKDYTTKIFRKNKIEDFPKTAVLFSQRNMGSKYFHITKVSMRINRHREKDIWPWTKDKIKNISLRPRSALWVKQGPKISALQNGNGILKFGSKTTRFPYHFSSGLTQHYKQHNKTCPVDLKDINGWLPQRSCERNHGRVFFFFTSRSSQ